MPTTVTFLETVGALSGIAFACLMNFSARKPLNTGIYKHIGCGIVGYFLGQKFEQFKEQKEREYIQIIEDYSINHCPLDFVEPPPKTYGDIMMPWHPVR